MTSVSFMSSQSVPASSRQLQRWSWHWRLAAIPALPAASRAPSRVAITCAVSMTSRAVTRLLGTSSTPAMLRADSANSSSGFTSMTSVLPVDAEPLQHLRGGLRLAVARPRARRRRSRAPSLQLLRERRAQRAAPHLLRQVELVAARLRPEHGAALAPQRVADLADAARRPVPFCRHGFLPLPLTSARFLVACVPRRSAAFSCTTDAQIRSRLHAAAEHARRSARARRPSRCCALTMSSFMIVQLPVAVSSALLLSPASCTTVLRPASRPAAAARASRAIALRTTT